VERRLLDAGRFNLPNRHRALELGEDLALVLLDATETPIERPKKNSAVTTVARKSATPSRLSC
jgi:hypothetical protein